MKKFVEKLKNLFKNKKLCTWLMASVLALTTLGTGIGLFIHNNINWGGGTSEIEDPQDENDPTKNNADSVNVTFDFNMGDTATTRSVNYFDFNEIKMFESTMSNYSKTNSTSTSISFNPKQADISNRFSSIKMQKFKELASGYIEDFHFEDSVAGKTYSWNFEVDFTYRYLRIGFNANISDGCFYYSTEHLANGKYTFRFTISAFDAYGFCTLTNFSITKDENTQLDSKINVTSEVEKGLSYVPNPTRTGYTFSGWYTKKNYLKESVMDSFMNWINAQERADKNATPSYISKNGNEYYWDSAAGATGSNPDAKYVYNTGLRLTGRYRLTYDAYKEKDYPDPSTCLKVCKNSSDAGGPYVYTTSWHKYEMVYEFNNEEFGLATGWWDYAVTHFKNIQFERIDINDIERRVTGSSSLNAGILENLTLYAVWTANMKVDPVGGSHSKNLLEGANSNSGCGYSHNMNLTYTASTGTYTLTNTSLSDPYAVLLQTAYLSLGTTYRMHVTLSSTAGSGIQIFYAINNGFTESQSLHFTGVDQVLTFIVPSTGTYNFRMDNDTGQTIRITNFYIAPNSISSSPITYSYVVDGDLGYQQLVPPTRTGYIFNGWKSSSTTISGNVARFTPGATITAQWTEIIYTLTVNFDSTTSWSNAPDSVMIEVVGGSSSTISKGGKCTITLGYTSFSSAKTIRATVTSASHSYHVSFNTKPTTSSSTGSASTTWGARTNLTVTLYVYQRHTISFDKGYADSGTVPSSIYKIYGTNVTLPTNSLTHNGFTPNGWNTSPDGTGASYADGEIYTADEDVTLYPNWRPYHANVEITIVTLDKSGSEISNIGGSVKVDYKTASNNQAKDVSETSTGDHLSFATLIDYESWAYATANAGYVFIGFSETGNVPHFPDEISYNYCFPPDYHVYSLSVYFQQVSDNVLKYDRDERYWYFEDGVYPQSEVDSSLAATLDSQSFSVASYTLQYNNGEAQTVYVYNYQGQDYARATVKGVSKWFVVEPIRWRVSEYGVSEDEKPDLWQNYGDTKSLVAASEKILFASIMTADRIDDSKATDSANFWLNNYVSTSDFKLTYDSDFSHNQDSFAGAGGQDVSQSGTVSTNVAVYSTKDTTLSSSAKLTAFASFLLYGTTAYVDTYDTYWTRDLDTMDGRSEYGCGVVVTSYGRETLRWLNQMCGVRLTYYCTEVSRY